ncbi:MAG: mechanosensitive ion channel [Flavobacteriales bacterium]|nr:mechanosensitive ion channel [Flavobacteriales bacterium]
MGDLSMDSVFNYLAQFSDLLIAYGGRIVLAILFLIIGLWLIKRLVRTVSRNMEKRNVNESLRPFLRSLLGAVLKIMLFISVATMVGVEMTSFIAVLGAAGLAVGLALQGSLSNFAGGVLILVLKPFQVGDFIDDGTHSGTVREIQIFYTYLTTFQKQEVIIPNGKLSNNAIKNFSFHDIRRIDLTFGISYKSDIDTAKAILSRLMQEDERFLTDPAPLVFVEMLNNSSVDLRFRVWAKNEDFWDLTNGMPEKVKKAFDKEGISIPFPQRDVHLFQK